MKMMKRKILHAGSSITVPEDHLRAYFAMSEHQLKSLEGNLQTVISAQLTQMLKAQGCKCPMNFCTAFRKLEHAILYDKPATPSGTVPVRDTASRRLAPEAEKENNQPRNHHENTNN